MKSMRRAAAIAVAIGLSATGHGTAQAASSPTIERPARSSAVLPVATAAAEKPEPFLAAADLKLGLFATHPMASKAGNTYELGTDGDAFCHRAGVTIPGALRDTTDTDGDGFCPFGQEITDIEFTRSGRLIATYGMSDTKVDSWGPVAGRVAVVPLNVQNRTWESPFLLRSDGVDIIRKLANGDLAIPLTDPSGRRPHEEDSPSGYATDRGGSWHFVRSSIWFHHAEDLAETPSGDIWLFGSGGRNNAAAIIARTTNNGSTWSLMKTYERPNTFLRYHNGSAIGSKVYASGTREGVIAYNGDSWSAGGPAGRCEYFQKACVDSGYFEVKFFDGKTTTTSTLPQLLDYGTSFNSHPDSGGYAASDGYLYQTSGGFVMRTKTVGGPWEAVGQFRSTPEKMYANFAVHGDRLYFGGPGGQIYRSAVTVTQAVQASKDAQAAAVKERERLLAPLKAEMAVADAEVTTAIRVDTAEDTANRAAYVKEQDGFIAERKSRVKALASSAAAPWATLLAEYAATDAAVSTRRESNRDADRARQSFWRNREDGHQAKAVARSARMDELIKAIPAPYDGKAKELKKASTGDLFARLGKAQVDRQLKWSAETSRVDGELKEILEANKAASKAAAKVQPSVAREAKHRSDNSAAEAKRTVGLQGSLFSSYAKFMDSQNKAALGLARAKPTPSVAGMKADSDRMSRVVKSEAAKAASLLASEAARADRVTVNERARANVDWAATAAAALPGTTELLTTHREILVKRATADRSEQKTAIEADAAARKGAVATYGAVRKQWWAEQGRSVGVTNSLFAAWVRHNASQEAVIARVRKEEEARAAKLKAGPPLSSAAKAAERKRLQDRVNRLKASSRKLNIDDFAVADRYYASEKKRSAAVYKWDAGMASKVGADQSAWTARAAGAQKARDARLYALNQQWKARISADRYARDAASNDLMRYAPR